MIRARHFELRSDQFIKVRPKGTCEQNVSVTYNVLR